MKKILFMLLLMSGIYTAKAGNGLIVSEAVIPLGGTGHISVDLNNDDYQFTAFTFKLSLPEGVSFELDNNDPPRPSFEKTERFSDHNLGSSYNSATHSGMFACLSLTSAPIQGTSGTILNLFITADTDYPVGTDFDATISQITVTTVDGKEVKFGDVAFKIIIDEADDGRIKFNETSTKLPSYTAGEKADVRMTRSIKAGQWSTLVLPFTLTKAKAEAAFGSDVELATFDGFETAYSDDDDVTPDALVLNFKTYTMTARNSLRGGNLYLIRTSKDIESFEADDVTLANAVTDTNKSDEYDTAGKFTGSLVKTVVPADGLFINDNKFWYSTGLTNIKAFRGWFELDAVLDKETDFGTKIRFNVDGDATEIDGIHISQSVDGVYNLQGQFIGDDVDLKRLPKGVYIVNGKKMYVK